MRWRVGELARAVAEIQSVIPNVARTLCVCGVETRLDALRAKHRHDSRCRSLKALLKKVSERFFSTV
jgi:hypothetical protein